MAKMKKDGCAYCAAAINWNAQHPACALCGRHACLKCMARISDRFPKCKPCMEFRDTIHEGLEDDKLGDDDFGYYWLLTDTGMRYAKHVIAASESRDFDFQIYKSAKAAEKAWKLLKSSYRGFLEDEAERMCL